MIREWVARGRLVVSGTVLGAVAATLTAAHAAPLLGQPCSVAVMPTPTFTGRTVTDPHTLWWPESLSAHAMRASDSRPRMRCAPRARARGHTLHRCVRLFKRRRDAMVWPVSA